MPRDIAATGGRPTAVGRDDAGRWRVAFGDGAGLLVDWVFSTARDATMLPLAPHAASTVRISSKAGSVDAHGHHSNSPVKPDFGRPVRQDQPLAAPGGGDRQTGEGYPAAANVAGGW